MSGYNFNKKATVGNWLVEVDTEAKYGYFESQKTGNGGGLWFQTQEDTGELELIDYDGVYSLPTDVAKALREEMDINVGEDFE